MRRAEYGIAGGYGATGSVVVSELHKTTAAQILIGGRDHAKGNTLAATLGDRVSAARLDVQDARSLDDFCGQCFTIVNCAGPVLELQDRVAQAALRNRCHYIDAAGLLIVKERLLPHAHEIEDLGLSFVISAGWMPGLCELLPAYADTVAKTRMQATESLTVYYSDGGDWSDNAMRDGVWYLHQRGLRSPGYFRRGEWMRVKTSAAFRTVNLGDNIANGRFCLVYTPELEELGRRLRDCDFSAYTYLSGTRTVLASALMAMVPLPDGFGVRLLRSVFRRNRFPVGGFVVARALGQSEGVSQAMTVQVTFESGRDYWIHGVMLATAARMVSHRAAAAGVHFLADAGDPVAFIGELRHAGVAFNESLATMVA